MLASLLTKSGMKIYSTNSLNYLSHHQVYFLQSYPIYCTLRTIFNGTCSTSVPLQRSVLDSVMYLVYMNELQYFPLSHFLSSLTILCITTVLCLQDASGVLQHKLELLLYWPQKWCNQYRKLLANLLYANSTSKCLSLWKGDLLWKKSVKYLGIQLISN